MRLRSGLLLVYGTLARVLHRQPGGDNQNLVQTAKFLCRDDHASYARVNRQFRELLADSGQAFLFVDGGQLNQQLVTVRDGFGGRCINERKLGYFAKPQRLHAKNHRRE